MYDGSLSNALLQHQTLDLNAIVAILGERPFKPKPSFQAYLDTKHQMQQQLASQMERVVIV